nr:MAG TPA: hypothetical protein [Caudoviricetes sp.]
MYSAKEKLTHFHKLVSPTVVEADLALLHDKAPHLTDFTRFDLAPEKNHEEILFLLLDHCEHDEIVRNRREYANQADDEDNNNANNSSEDGNEDPKTLNSNGDESPDANGGEGDKNPSTGEGGDDSSKKEKAKAAPKKKKKSTRK